MKLNVRAIALASGIIWGGGIFLLAIFSIFFSTYSNIIIFISNYYIGLDVSFVGGLIGFVWGFIDAGVGGALFAWLYNKFI
tara:strand:+ start:707 stop:949 length:243 start_codon:yes stop_codon:yes gene_type:complete